MNWSKGRLSKLRLEYTSRYEEPMTWIYVMEETALPEGSMAPVYSLGVNQDKSGIRMDMGRTIAYRGRFL